MKTPINGISTDAITLSIDESSSEVDGVHILAKVRGPFFIPDGTSRNRRFYPRELWESVCKKKELKEQLENRTMFGSISHDTPLDDVSFRDGKFSHIVTKFGFNENGEPDCEALVVNTPTGRILNTFLRAGSKVFVSTRADGQFKGKTNEGLPIVDKETFSLRAVDFVLRPGFLAASPELTEALNEAYEELKRITYSKNEGDSKMEQKLLEEAIAKRMELEKKVTALESQCEALKSEVSISNRENTLLKEESDNLRREVKMLEGFNDLNESVEVVKSKVSMLEEYKKFGTIEEMKSIQEKMAEFKEITEKFGNKDALQKAFDLSNGISEELKKIHTEFGSYEQIKEGRDLFQKMIEEQEATEQEAAIAKVAAECGCKPEAVKKLMDKGMSADEASELLKSLKESEGEDEDEDGEGKGDDEGDDVTEEDGQDGEGEDEEEEDEEGQKPTESLKKNKKNSKKKSTRKNEEDEDDFLGDDEGDDTELEDEEDDYTQEDEDGEDDEEGQKPTESFSKKSRACRIMENLQ